MIVNDKKYYLFMDGLRGIAILWVLFHHIFIFFDIKSYSLPFFPFVQRFMSIGVFGVDIFFVISGFLITGLLLPDVDEGRIHFKRFYVRRFFKIVPQYLLIVFLGLIVEAMFRYPGIDGNPNYDPWGYLWRYLFFIQNYDCINQIPTLAHLWTIAVEEQFYLIFPLLLAGVCLLFKNIDQRKQFLVVFSVILLLLANLLRHIQTLQAGIFFFQQTHLHFDGLALGVLIKLMEKQIVQNENQSRAFVSWIMAAAAVGVYCVFGFGGIHVERWWTLALACLAPGFLLISALNGGCIEKIGESSILRWVGKSSYAIYLWHYVLLFLPRINRPYFIAVYFIVTILAGYISTITLERYFLDYRKRLKLE